MTWEYIKSSRKEHTCSCCGDTIYVGESYYRNGNKVHCELCGKTDTHAKPKKVPQSNPTQNLKYSPKVYRTCGLLMKILAVVVLIVFGLPFGLVGLLVAGIFAVGIWILGNSWSKLGKNPEMLGKTNLTNDTVTVTTSDYSELFEKSKIICVDVETTGLSTTDDEILKLSIIDGNYEVLFNEYIKPSRKTEWPDAQKINGISPEQVENMPTIEKHITVLNKIFEEAELLVGYNIKKFDSRILTAAGVNIPRIIDYYDVMLEFAPIYGEWDDYHKDYKWQKLTTCAKFYDYDWGDDVAHDSLSDVKATLHCFMKMVE